MATETRAPDALLVQTGLTGAVTAIDEDPATPDASWLTTAANTNTEARVSFPTPTGNPRSGAGLQTFRVRVRKTAQSTNPTCVVELWESGGGAALATVVASTTVSSTTGVTLSGTWNAALLGTPSGANVECRVVGTVGGGSPGNRASVEVGAIAWDVDYQTSTQTPKVLTASLSPAGSIVRKTRKGGIAAAVGPTGALVRKTRRAITAAIGPAGALTRRTGRGHAASLSFEAALTTDHEAAPTPALTAVLIRSI